MASTYWNMLARQPLPFVKTLFWQDQLTLCWPLNGKIPCKMRKIKAAFIMQKQNVYQQRDTGAISLFPHIGCLSSAFMYCGQSQNSNCDFCIYWVSKSFQSFHSSSTPLQTCVERRGRLCFHNNCRRINFCFWLWACQLRHAQRLFTTSPVITCEVSAVEVQW